MKHVKNEWRDSARCRCRYARGLAGQWAARGLARTARGKPYKYYTSGGAAAVAAVAAAAAVGEGSNRPRLKDHCPSERLVGAGSSSASHRPN